MTGKKKFSKSLTEKEIEFYIEKEIEFYIMIYT